MSVFAGKKHRTYRAENLPLLFSCEVQFYNFTPDEALEDVNFQSGCSTYFVSTYPLHVDGVTWEMYLHLFSAMQFSLMHLA